MPAVTAEQGRGGACKEVASDAVRSLQPVLSVLTITYNHQPFIEECIQGVVAQKTSFAVELVIGEDCSKDKTRELCLAYQQRYPGLIRLLLHSRNVGPLWNFLEVFKACRGRYVALLEGDDLWTDPRKLQKQVELLEQHPEWTACFHNVNFIGDRSAAAGDVFFPAKAKEAFGLGDFVERNFVPTCSCVFRNRGTSILPAWFCDVQYNPYADWVLHVLHARYVEFGYVHEVMASHRRHSGGSWGRTFDGSLAGDLERMRKRETAFRRLEECMSGSYRKALRRQRGLAHFHLALAYRESGERAKALSHFLKGLCLDPRSDAPLLQGLVKTILNRKERNA
jgi:glycosyltransferase involved in cell wall biosynthesis